MPFAQTAIAQPIAFGESYLLSRGISIDAAEIKQTRYMVAVEVRHKDGINRLSCQLLTSCFALAQHRLRGEPQTKAKMLQRFGAIQFAPAGIDQQMMFANRHIEALYRHFDAVLAALEQAGVSKRETMCRSIRHRTGYQRTACLDGFDLHTLSG